jgi:hypothetical protein
MTNAKSSTPDMPDSSDQLQVPERRSADRVQTVFRVARVISAADEGLARITNLSDLGARLRMLIALPLSDSLTLQLADGVELSGRVVWNEGDEFGLQFDQPISCSELLTTLAAGARCGLTRPVRLPIATTALTRSERGLHRAEVIDISQRGLKLLHDGSMAEGMFLEVTLPSGLDRRGVVRWTKGNIAGVMLLEPLSVEVLGSAKNLVSAPAPAPWLTQAAGTIPRS